MTVKLGEPGTLELPARCSSRSPTSVEPPPPAPYQAKIPRFTPDWTVYEKKFRNDTEGSFALKLKPARTEWSH